MAATQRLQQLIRRQPPSPVATLAVEQAGPTLTVRFTLRPGTRPAAAWVHLPAQDLWRRIADLAPEDSEYRLDIDLNGLVGAIPDTGEPGSAHLYLEPAGGKRRPERTRPNRPVPLGLAGRTEHGRFSQVDVAGRVATPYLSSEGVVSVRIDEVIRAYGMVYVYSLRGRGGVLRLRGRINGRHSEIRTAELVLKGRTSGRRIVAPVRLRSEPRRAVRRRGHYWYRFAVELDWTAVFDDGAVTDIFDAWMAIDVEGPSEAAEVRIGRTRFHVRQLSRPSWAVKGDDAVAVQPYYTFRARRTSFHVDAFAADTMQYLRRRLKMRHLDRLRYRGKPIWLVGELPYKAQDTGLAMFRHLRRAHPEVDAYYVMDTDSPEYANVAPLGNVVPHRSKEHVRLSLLATRVLGSHHPDFLYPLRTEQFRKAVRAARVFLQHGVIAIKWMTPLYGKGLSDFDTDLFIVSSEREKQYIVSDFGWRPEEIAVTGLSRFDTLFTDDVPPRRQLMIMPTWRPWLLDVDQYTGSEYHERWSSLLHSERLAKLLDEHDMELVFCLHPNMRVFSHLFADTPARVINQGEVDVQHLLKESAVLVTDFSSVGFDFAFLNKPVAYYQFDRARVLDVRGAHIDLDNELPGTIAVTEDALLDDLERIVASGCRMPPDMAARADRFIAHRDNQNSERIFQAALRVRRHRFDLDRLRTRPLPSVAFRVWRRSRWYFPSMRLLFRLATKFPADPNRVVFEAGLGRQYADSPRYIYEELVRRGAPMRKIWAYDGKIHTDDPQTQVVERLSVGYFWHLARAKYWVNSQNFPYYLARRPDGVFVQTWHGTPLKRMLQDVEEVHGRDEGYVQRMLQAAAQWSVLVSPSPYATTAISSAYGYSGPVLEAGYPRNDSLLAGNRDELAEQVRKRIGVRPGQRVILYAPTFRDDQIAGRGKFNFAMPFDLARAADRLGSDTVLLLRMHVVVSSAISIPPELTDRIIDVSRYPEIQDLYLISDAVVTDYSSVFFDYALLRRPIVFYAHDLDNYRDRLRGFYLDYPGDLPGPVVTTEDALYDTLTDLEAVRARYADKYEAFLQRFAPHDDGHATERVVDAVFGAAAPAAPEPRVLSGSFGRPSGASEERNK
jgi:CDP-glycerol glycerophosphotransferase